MILTEAEAAKCWCPQARVAFFGEAANRISTERLKAALSEADRTGDRRDLEHIHARIADTRCIGSLCMWWRYIGYRPVAAAFQGQDEAHGCCGAAPDVPPPTEHQTQDLVTEAFRLRVKIERKDRLLQELDAAAGGNPTLRKLIKQVLDI